MKGGIGGMVVRRRGAGAARRAAGAATWSSARTPTRSRPARAASPCVRHGVRADAGIVTEPTGFEVWTACRGSLTPVVTVEGRPGPRRADAAALARRAARSTRSRRCGVVLDAVARLRDDWREPRRRAGTRTCSPATIMPDSCAGGEWNVTYPVPLLGHCRCSVPAGQRRRGRLGHATSRRSSSAGSRDAAACRPVAARAPADESAGRGHPACEMPADHPIVRRVLGARPARRSASRRASAASTPGTTRATFTRFGDTP